MREQVVPKASAVSSSALSPLLNPLKAEAKLADPPMAEILAEDLDRIKELERWINEKEPDFLIGLHLEGCIPEEANAEELARIFTNALSILPKRAGAHYKVNLNTLGLNGFANLYFVAPGMGGVFCYNRPLISEEATKDMVCPPN